MAKEWVLNKAFNRWQLNRPKFVGMLMEAIRECDPRDYKEWEEYYYTQVPKKHVPKGWQMFGENMEAHLEEIGRRLYAKISEQLKHEVEEVTVEDCIEYVREVVLLRTYQGYMSERKTVYGQIEEELKELDIQLCSAPDEWDRLYNVDFYVPVGEKAVGIQIKPISYSQAPELHQWKEWMKESHEKFEKERGGKVFIVFSIITDKDTKSIYNQEVVDEIRQEIERLRTSSVDS